MDRHLSQLLILLILMPALAMGSSSAPVWVVGQCHAPASTQKEDFIRQVAFQASSWTDSTGFEVCGRLARDEQGAWAMTLTTNYSQLACLVVDGLAPEDYTVIGDKFHTHPAPDELGRIAIHPHTRQFTSAQGSHILDGLTHIQLSNPQGFSNQDLLNGGGYLATAGRLLFHKDGQTQDLGLVEPSTPVCSLSR